MFKTKFFQLAFPAYLICIHMILCHMTAAGLLKDPKRMDNSLDFKTYYHLYNMRSGMHVQITGEIPRATARMESDFTELEVISHPVPGSKMGKADQVAVTLMGNHTRRFICFNKKGKLITKFSWTYPNCLFEEELVGGAYEFHLIDKPSWKLSFNRRGKPIKATAQPTRHADSCSKFMKREEKNNPQGPFEPVGPFNSSEVLAESIRKKERESRIRSYRRRRRRTTPSSGARTTAVPKVLRKTSPIPLVRIRRQNHQLLRTLRLLKLLE